MKMLNQILVGAEIPESDILSPGAVNKYFQQACRKAWSNAGTFAARLREEDNLYGFIMGIIPVLLAIGTVILLFLGITKTPLFFFLAFVCVCVCCGILYLRNEWSTKGIDTRWMQMDVNRATSFLPSEVAVLVSRIQNLDLPVSIVVHHLWGSEELKPHFLEIRDDDSARLFVRGWRFDHSVTRRLTEESGQIVETGVY